MDPDRICGHNWQMERQPDGSVYCPVCDRTYDKHQIAAAKEDY